MKIEVTRKKERVIILGVHDGHNAGVALIADVVVLAAINEERLNNIKDYSGVPHLALRKVLEISGVTPQQISTVCISSRLRLDNPTKVDSNELHFMAEHFAQYCHGNKFIHVSIDFFQFFRKKKELFEALTSLGLDRKSVQFIEHHQAHVACAYYQRPWDDKTLVLTLDGMGDGLSATVGIGKGNQVERIAETGFYDSIGNNLYSEVTAYLGMKRWEHEYKVMGLAPYGKPDGIIEDFRTLFRINPQHPLMFENISGHYLKQMQHVYRKILEGKRFDNIAAATQKHYEELIVQWVKNAIAQTHIHKVVCAGGSFLNVKVNMLIRQLEEVEDFFVYPAAEDGGSAVGAALEGYYRHCQTHGIEPIKSKLTNIYYGEEHSNDEIREFIIAHKLSKKAHKVSAKDVATLLSHEQVIARFAGRDEWGPRALGNRSILADPRNLSVIRKINFAIKQRDFWMPFGPAVLNEDKDKYFVNARFAPYMIEAFQTKKEARDIIDTLHPYDLTGRPQTVNNWNPGFHDIISEFKKKTGVGGVLNTSFNLHGSPMCGTLEHALETFQNSALDGLLLGDWLVSR